MRRRSLLIRGGGSSGDACFERRELDAGENIPFDEASLAWARDGASSHGAAGKGPLARGSEERKEKGD